jgi:hypothetical protein
VGENPIEFYRRQRNEARAEENEAHGERQEVMRRETIRKAYVNAGGDELNFDKVYPSLRQRFVEEETLRNAMKGK